MNDMSMSVATLLALGHFFPSLVATDELESPDGWVDCAGRLPSGMLRKWYIRSELFSNTRRLLV